MQHIEQIMTNPRASAATVGATVASSWANFFDVANHQLTTVATITGIILSWTMIIMHIRKMRREDAEHRLIMKKIDLEISELARKHQI